MTPGIYTAFLSESEVRTGSLVLRPGSVDSDWLEEAFYRSVGKRYHTRLRGGASEPFYTPASAGSTADIHYRLDYIRSALHEVAHWCVAGGERRRLPDYGYWYTPDGRDAMRQAAFFTVEARPQALERLFCEALGIPFLISADNPGVEVDRSLLARFEDRVQGEVERFQHHGLPARARMFLHTLRGA